MTSQPQTQPRRVSHNAITQMVGRVFYLLTRVGLPPFILHHISPEEYGLWATCFLIISYIGIGAFGVSNVYIRFVAEYSATRRTGEIGRLIATGLCLTTAFSVVVFAALWVAMPWLNGWFKIPVALQATARALILGTVATMLLDMTFGAFAYVLTGLHRIVEQTVVWIVSVVLETVLIVGFLLEGYGVEGMLWAFVLRYIFATCIYAVLVYRALPGLRLSLSGPGTSPLRLFLSYGGIMQLTGLLGIFLYSSERVIAGALNGIAAVGVLDIGQKFPVMSSQVFNSASSSILVGLTHLQSTGMNAEAIRLYRRSARYINLLNGGAMGFMAAFATPIVVAWIGANPAYREAGVIMILAAIGFHVHALTGPATIYCQSINRPALAITHFQAPQLALLVIGLQLGYLYSERTLLDVIIVAACARVLSSLGFIFYTNRRIGMSQFSYFRGVVLPGLMPYTVGYGLALACQPWIEAAGAARIPLILNLSVMAVLYGLCVLMILALLMEPEEKERVRRQLRRFV